MSVKNNQQHLGNEANVTLCKKYQPCSQATFSWYAVCSLQMSYTGTQPIKRSCDRVANLVKYYLMLSGNESRPKGTHSESKAFRARHEVPRRKRDSFVPSHYFQRFSGALDNILLG